jgi:hypothetical protein
MDLQRLRRLGLRACAVALLVTGAPIDAQVQVGTGDASRSTGLISSGPDPDLFLMYTGDVIGYLDACG